MKFIKKHIRAGTTVISDCWKAYNTVGLEGYVHLTVNHSENFKDPKTGAHTNTIERTWREVRANIPRFGQRKKHMVRYLAEYIFKRSFPEFEQRIHEFYKAASKLYSVY